MQVLFALNGQYWMNEKVHSPQPAPSHYVRRNSSRINNAFAQLATSEEADAVELLEELAQTEVLVSQRQVSNA